MEGDSIGPRSVLFSSEAQPTLSQCQVKTLAFQKILPFYKS